MPNYTPRPQPPQAPPTAVRAAVVAPDMGEGGMKVSTDNPTWRAPAAQTAMPAPAPVVPAQPAMSQQVPAQRAPAPVSMAPAPPANPRAALMANLPPGAKAIIDARMQTNRTAGRKTPLVRK